jgi:hypothetical protein
MNRNYVPPIVGLWRSGRDQLYEAASRIHGQYWLLAIVLGTLFMPGRDPKVALE